MRISGNADGTPTFSLNGKSGNVEDYLEFDNKADGLLVIELPNNTDHHQKAKELSNCSATLRYTMHECLHPPLAVSCTNAQDII